MMTTTPPKRSASTSIEESSLSDSASGREDEKTIPFLRRLRDMLKENDDVISFVAGGYTKTGGAILGRIVVHDRIQVEEKVLPRYFNHASFASLRRQLNYFSFVRLGKGRQRESTYINEAVVELDDILHLKRRSSGGAGSSSALVATHAVTPRDGLEISSHELHEDPETGRLSGNAVVSVAPETEEGTVSEGQEEYFAKHSKLRKAKRRRIAEKKAGAAMPEPTTSATTNDFSASITTQANNLISEDELSDRQHYETHRPKGTFFLDLTRPDADEEVLAGCSALLGLSSQQWS